MDEYNEIEEIESKNNCNAWLDGKCICGKDFCPNCETCELFN